MSKGMIYNNVHSCLSGDDVCYKKEETDKTPECFMEFEDNYFCKKHKCLFFDECSRGIAGKEEELLNYKGG
ncbi:MAG: hypothetical protein V1651_03915 [Patescibacteria group bacterium]